MRNLAFALRGGTISGSLAAQSLEALAEEVEEYERQNYSDSEEGSNGMTTFSLIWAAAQLVTLIAAIGCAIFGEGATQEELERASMRSLSWPTKRP